MPKQLSTFAVANLVGVHKDTLLRWLRAGQIPEPKRDRRGWRVFSQVEANAIVRFAKQAPIQFQHSVREVPTVYGFSAVEKLKKIDWDFHDAVTDYLTHSLHPYPAKFIPQIPNTLIQELSSVGDTVLDIFCGSGTTLVEALLLKRHAIGIDANPLACLISCAKTLRLSGADLQELRDLDSRVAEWAANMNPQQLPLFGSLNSLATVERPTSPSIEFWFAPFVVDELAAIRALCQNLATETARTLALTAFSSIIVNVSRQDSDTRYVRREKRLEAGDTVRRFQKALVSATEKAVDFTEATEPRFHCHVHNANILEPPSIKDKVDLMVCSPPYPNAYSYHLYHMTRMLWLGMDQPTFKKNEIGSHRKYSLKGANGATLETFRSELETILRWLKTAIRTDGYACFVVGDSTLNGRTVHNSDLLIEAAAQEGFDLQGNIERKLQASRKSFNPSIGKIKTEKIVILRNSGGANG